MKFKLSNRVWQVLFLLTIVTIIIVLLALYSHLMHISRTEGTKVQTPSHSGEWIEIVDFANYRPPFVLDRTLGGSFLFKCAFVYFQSFFCRILPVIFLNLL